MPEYFNSFINLVLLGIIALFPVVNPIGSAFMVNPYFENLSTAEKNRAVNKIALYAFLICTIALFVGEWILQLFGISIPIVQLAGGIMICKMGWEFLSSDEKTSTDNDRTNQVNTVSAYEHIANKLFYPITFPATTGAGTISVIFTLSAHGASGKVNTYVNTAAILVSILVICILIYTFYRNTKKLIRFMGANGENVVNRISAFLIFCVGLQIGISGLKALFKL